MKPKPILLWLWLCCAMGFVSQLCALDIQQGSRLDQIRLEVESQSAKLKELESSASALEKEIKVKQTETALLREQEGNLKIELQSLLQRKTDLEEEIRLSQERIDRTRKYALARLRAAYMQKPARLWEMLLSATRIDRGRQAFFLRKIQEADLRSIHELLLLIESYAKSKLELDGLVAGQEKLSKQVAEKRAALEGKIGEQKKAGQELKQRKAEIALSLTGLKAEALRLETVMVGLTGGEEEQPPSKKSSSAPAQEGVPSEPIKFEGRGLFRQKGALLLPVQGKVVQNFGKHKMKEFSDFVFSKGVEYEVAPGGKVSAIADGKVIYVGRMPGYGTIVILDHGERYYSLYGRLGEVSVNLGEVLAKGSQLASCAEKDDRNRNFYFEIRRSGMAVNPQDYYRRLS